MSDADVPEPGQTLNTGEVAVPRVAATVILLRGGSETLELLLVRRTPEARFMGGVWVFPGGAVDTGEGEGDDANRAAAVRELEEEAAVTGVDPSSLVLFSRWITPAEVAIRFDTWFYLAEAPPDAEPQVDGQECVDLGWFTPQGALDAGDRGEIDLVFPTVKHLEQLAPFATARELLDHARKLVVRPVQPKIVVEGEVARAVMPGEPGYE
jgi:8-oxo-dGTP pyrophosphatase MutT (NUDIX family)